MSEWISVEDRLPIHEMALGWDGDYQFVMMINGVLHVHYNDSEGWQRPSARITHWMPLPEPPEVQS